MLITLRRYMRGAAGDKLPLYLCYIFSGCLLCIEFYINFRIISRHFAYRLQRFHTLDITTHLLQNYIGSRITVLNGLGSVKLFLMNVNQ